MVVRGFDPQRAKRIAELAVECRPLLEQEGGMEAVQRLLADRSVGVMDSILVTRRLMGEGPGALGEAKNAVLSSGERATERVMQDQLVSDLIAQLDAEQV
jgi:hypothetical protein